MIVARAARTFQIVDPRRRACRDRCAVRVRRSPRTSRCRSTRRSSADLDDDGDSETVPRARGAVLHERRPEAAAVRAGRACVRSSSRWSTPAGGARSGSRARWTSRASPRSSTRTPTAQAHELRVRAARGRDGARRAGEGRALPQLDADGCVAVQKTLFSYPRPETIGKRPKEHGVSRPGSSRSATSTRRARASSCARTRRTRGRATRAAARAARRVTTLDATSRRAGLQAVPHEAHAAAAAAARRRAASRVSRRARRARARPRRRRRRRRAGSAARAWRP